MEFKKQTVVIKGQRLNDPTVVEESKEAYVGVCTGLAYRQDVEVDGSSFYVLMHLQSGYCFPCYPDTEAQVRAWLEKVADLVPNRWDCDLPTYLEMIKTIPGLKKAVYDAFNEVMTPAESDK